MSTRAYHRVCALFILIIAGALLTVAAMIMTGGRITADAAPAPAIIAPALPTGYVAERPSTCQSAALADALRLVPRDTHYRWVWGDLHGTAAGDTYPTLHVVVIDPGYAPCAYMHSIVYHEWMHSAGALSSQMYHGVPFAEVDADCGNVLIFHVHPVGKLWAPYIPRFGGCTSAIDAQARAIMAGK